MRIERRIRLGLVALFLLISAIVFVTTRQPAETSPVTHDGYRILPGKGGPVLDWTEADFSLTDSRTIPAGGWQRHALPYFDLLKSAVAAHLDPPTAWARLRFDQTIFGGRPISLYVGTLRDNFTLYLNGAELYRSRSEANDPSLAWNQPSFLVLPPAMLRPGVNEVTIRIATISIRALGLGEVRIGPDRDIRAVFNTDRFLSNIAPEVISGYLLILTIGALSLWMKRRREPVFGLFALVGCVFLFRNLQYFVLDPPLDPPLFWDMITDAAFVLVGAMFAFAAAYFQFARARFLMTFVALFSLALLLLRHLLTALKLNELPAYLLTIPITVLMLVLVFDACRRKPVFANWSMFGAILLTTLFAYHDVVFSFDIGRGFGFSLLPYGALLIFAAFDAALTSRLQTALVDVEDVNLKLEARVADVTQSLARSEAARAELQVAQAVGLERDRIMREIHDGIGSSLLTALTGARVRGESPETVATLTRSLTDLRIGVDSLEPVDGDVVALLANLRHRMERELKGAGFAFVWKVDPCPRLPWLDPIGALHVLRIVQEAIGNAVAHSGAQQVEVLCCPHSHDGVAGILIGITDTGAGFDTGTPSRGKGLANMAARAEALSGEFRCESIPGTGTGISIWLPLDKT
jgi:signal transduction histidine kinase